MHGESSNVLSPATPSIRRRHGPTRRVTNRETRVRVNRAFCRELDSQRTGEQGSRERLADLFSRDARRASHSGAILSRSMPMKRFHRRPSPLQFRDRAITRTRSSLVGSINSKNWSSRLRSRRELSRALARNEEPRQGRLTK